MSLAYTTLSALLPVSCLNEPRCSRSDTNHTVDAFFIFFLIDRVGRRKPLLFGTVGISLCLIVEAVLNSKNPDGENESLSRAGVAMIFLVSMVFSVSFGPISWTYMSEVMVSKSLEP